MQTLNIAVLSFAHGHANAYCDAIAAFKDAKVLAAWDDNPERGQAASEKHGLDWHADFDSLLARPDIHAVIVTSPTNQHAKIIEAACAAGKNILCQKPLGDHCGRLRPHHCGCRKKRRAFSNGLSNALRPAQSKNQRMGQRRRRGPRRGDASPPLHQFFVQCRLAAIAERVAH